MPARTAGCDVLIVGGGPAGSACARTLVGAGLNVLVVDRARFPRDKTCAGWITPQVVAELQLDVEHYRNGRTFQAILGFRTGIIGTHAEVETRYPQAVSYGIRRCEFDHYLLERSGARVEAATPIASLRFSDGRWLVNGCLEAPMLVGAGGHFCPVARWLHDGGSSVRETAVVAAREAELELSAEEARGVAIDPECPELYFSPDLRGYGWCFRKERHINLGFGSLERHSLPQATETFVGFLKSKRRIPDGLSLPWRGHAYALQTAHRPKLGAGVLLIGDAAGLAYPESGEGIRPAIESGVLAAMTILESAGDYSLDRLQAYERRLASRFGAGGELAIRGLVPPAALAAAGRRLLRWPAFVRHVVLDRWFLHAGTEPLTPETPACW